MKLIREIGMEFPTKNSKQKKRYGLYECPVCKIHFKTMTSRVNCKQTTKCRRCSVIKHGENGSRLHQIWKGMKGRCYNQNNPAYKYYGEKGIIVDISFGEYQDFKNWAELNGYMDGLTIDRINSNGNYEPSNCRWITNSENSIRSSTRDNHGRNKNIKISEDMASEICEAYATGLFKQKDIADGLNVSRPTISRILKESEVKIHE